MGTTLSHMNLEIQPDSGPPRSLDPPMARPGLWAGAAALAKLRQAQEALSLAFWLLGLWGYIRGLRLLEVTFRF